MSLACCLAFVTRPHIEIDALLPLSPPLKSPHEFDVDSEYTELSRPEEMPYLEVVFSTNGFPEQLVKKTFPQPPKPPEKDNQPNERPTLLYTIHS